MEIKSGTTWDLATDYTGAKKRFLNNLIDRLGYARSECGRTVYLMDDNGAKFRLEQMTGKPSVWYQAIG